MKTFRKILALVLAVMVTLALAVPAFAEGDDTPAAPTYTITVTNATKDHTYAAYKLFDASVGADGAIVYSYDSELTENDYFEQDDNGYVTATEAATDSETGKLTAGAITFLASLVDVENDIPAASENATADTLTLTVTEPGYYYVTSTLGAVVTIDTTKPTVKIIDKNQAPSWDNDDPGDPDDPDDDNNGIGKVIVLSDGSKVTSNTANYGDVVNFDIGINATNFNGTEMITYYYITDTLDAGFTLADSFVPVVTVGSNTLTVGEDYTLTVDDNTFDIVIKWAELDGEDEDAVLESIYSNAVEIHVSYSATVNNSAELGAEGNDNEANFTFDSVPYDPENPPKEDPEPDPDPEYPEDPKITTTYVYAIGLEKVDSDHDPLPGATFKLVSDDDKTSENYITLSGSNGVYSFAANGTATTLDCDANGKLLIKGLAAGTYYLVEVDAPEGYNKNDTPIEIVIAESATDADTTTYAAPVAFTREFINNSGSELPATGGIGTTLFITFGAIAMLGAGVFLVTNKRISKEEI